MELEEEGGGESQSRLWSERVKTLEEEPGRWYLQASILEGDRPLTNLRGLKLPETHRRWHKPYWASKTAEKKPRVGRGRGGPIPVEAREPVEWTVFVYPKGQVPLLREGLLRPETPLHRRPQSGHVTHAAGLFAEGTRWGGVGLPRRGLDLTHGSKGGEFAGGLVVSHCI